MTKRLEQILTDHGIKTVEWREKDEFVNRSNKIYSGRPGYDKFKLIKEIPIPDYEVNCDYCNAEITDFPVPVIDNYALCTECLEGMRRSMKN
jgi:hypothetical protein